MKSSLCFVLLLMLTACMMAQAKQYAKVKPQHRNSRHFYSRLNEDLPLKVRRVLAHTDDFELFSLDPGLTLDSEQNQGEIFWGHQVLGKIFIRDAGVRHRLLNSFYSGIVHSWEAMACFNPRHGIRATYKGQTVELLICFECRIYQGTFGKEELDFRKVSKAPEKIFNRILRSANVPLSEK